MNPLLVLAAGSVAVVLTARARSSVVAARLTPGPVRRPAVVAPGPRGGIVRRVVGPIVSRRRRIAITWELPAVAELLRTALSAGLPPTLAVRVVTPLAPPVSAGFLASVMTGVDLGLGLDRALDPFRATGPEGAAISDALASSAELGVPIEDALARIATDGRAGLRRAAEARARTVPVRLLFPLVFCVLPAFALLGVAPSLIAGLSG